MEKKSWGRARFEEAIGDSLDDLGDVGDFEQPAIHEREIFDFFLKEVVDSNDVSFRSAVDKTIKQFDIPIEQLAAICQQAYDGTLFGTESGFYGYDCLRDLVHFLVGGIQKEPLNESLEDEIGDVGDFEEPPKTFYAKINVPDDTSKHREVWKYDGKVIEVQRGERPEYNRVYHNPLYRFGAMIPVEWCTPVEAPELDTIHEALDVTDFLFGEPRDGKPTQEQIQQTYMRLMARKRNAQSWGIELVVKVVAEVAKKLGIKAREVWMAIRKIESIEKELGDVGDFDGLFNMQMEIKDLNDYKNEH